jgi:hypothetical protein
MVHGFPPCGQFAEPWEHDAPRRPLRQLFSHINVEIFDELAVSIKAAARRPRLANLVAALSRHHLVSCQ